MKSILKPLEKEDIQKKKYAPRIDINDARNSLRRDTLTFRKSLKKYYEKYPEDLEEKRHTNKENEDEFDNISFSDRMIKEQKIYNKIASGIPLGDDDKNYINMAKSMFKKTVNLNPSSLVPENVINSPESIEAYHNYLKKKHAEAKYRSQVGKNVAVTGMTIAVGVGFFILSGYISVPLGLLGVSAETTKALVKFLGDKRFRANVSIQFFSFVKKAQNMKTKQDVLRLMAREGLPIVGMMVTRSVTSYMFPDPNVGIWIFSGTFSSQFVQGAGNMVFGQITNMIVSAPQEGEKNLEEELTLQADENFKRIQQNRILLNQGLLTFEQMEKAEKTTQEGKLYKTKEFLLNEHRTKTLFLVGTGLSLGIMQMSIPYISELGYVELGKFAQAGVNFSGNFAIRNFILPFVLTYITSNTMKFVNMAMYTTLTYLSKYKGMGWMNPNYRSSARKWLVRKTGYEFFYNWTLYNVLTKIMGITMNIQAQNLVLLVPNFDGQALYEAADKKKISDIISASKESLFENIQAGKTNVQEWMNDIVNKLRGIPPEPEIGPVNRGQEVRQQFNQLELQLVEMNDELEKLRNNFAENGLTLGGNEDEIRNRIAELEEKLDQTLSLHEQAKDQLNNPQIRDVDIVATLKANVINLNGFLREISNLNRIVKGLADNFYDKAEMERVKQELLVGVNNINQGLSELKDKMSEIDELKKKLDELNVGYDNRQENAIREEISKLLEKSNISLENIDSLDITRLIDLLNKQGNVTDDIKQMFSRILELKSSYMKAYENEKISILTRFGEINGGIPFNESKMSLKDAQKIVKQYNNVAIKRDILKNQVNDLKHKQNINKKNLLKMRGFLSHLRGKKGKGNTRHDELYETAFKNVKQAKEINREINKQLESLTDQLDHIEQTLTEGFQITNNEELKNALQVLESLDELTKNMTDTIDIINQNMDVLKMLYSNIIKAFVETMGKPDATEQEAIDKLRREQGKFLMRNADPVAIKKLSEKFPELKGLAEQYAQFVKTKDPKDFPTIDQLNELENLKDLIRDSVDAKYKEDVDEEFKSETSHLAGVNYVRAAVVGGVLAANPFTFTTLGAAAVKGGIGYLSGLSGAKGGNFLSSYFFASEAASQMANEMDNETLEDMADFINDLGDARFRRYTFTSVALHGLLDGPEIINNIYQYKHGDISAPRMMFNLGRGEAFKAMYWGTNNNY